MTLEPSYKTKQVAALLSCDEETVLRYAQRGELRSWRLGRERRYTESAIREFQQGREEQVPGRVVRMRRKVRA